MNFAKEYINKTPEQDLHNIATCEISYVNFKLNSPLNVFAKISLCDFNRVRNFKWFYHRTRGYVFTTTAIPKKTTYLHRFILNTSLYIDHKNHIYTDCTRENLRPATQSQNMWNRHIHKNSKSGYKGVFPIPNRKTWRAAIGKNRKLYYIGTFPTPELAALAYNKAAIKYHGEFAYLNPVGVSL